MLVLPIILSSGSATGGPLSERRSFTRVAETSYDVYNIITIDHIHNNFNQTKFYKEKVTIIMKGDLIVKSSLHPNAA